MMFSYHVLAFTWSRTKLWFPRDVSENYCSSIKIRQSRILTIIANFLFKTLHEFSKTVRELSGTVRELSGVAARFYINSQVGVQVLVGCPMVAGAL